jgi:hypothetical protein
MERKRVTVQGSDHYGYVVHQIRGETNEWSRKILVSSQYRRLEVHGKCNGRLKGDAYQTAGNKF